MRRDRFAQPAESLASVASLNCSNEGIEVEES
jgi:hypothetical protein